MPDVVVLRTNFDFASSYSYFWGSHIIDCARSRGFRVADISGPAATWQNLSRELEASPEIAAAFICTHGSPDCVVGDLDEALLVACRNDGCLSGRVAYYGACEAGLGLGKSTSRKGSPLVVGYLKPFIWHVDTRFPPEEDPVAKPFGEVYLEPARAMLDGLGPRAVYERTLRRYDRVSSEVAAGAEPETAMMLNALEHDRSALVAYGEKTTLKAPVNWIPLAALGIAGALIYLVGRKTAGMHQTKK